VPHLATLASEFANTALSKLSSTLFAD